MKTHLSKIVILFTALTITGVCLVVFGQESAEEALRNIFPLLGAVLFASGLTYLLVKVA